MRAGAADQSGRAISTRSRQQTALPRGCPLSDQTISSWPSPPGRSLYSTLRVSLPYSVVLSVRTVRTCSFICDTDSDNSIRWPADSSMSLHRAGNAHAHVARRCEPMCHVRSCGLALFFGP